MSKTVLIVEDEKELCELIAIQIDIPNVKVFQSYSGIEALQILRAEKIDLIITDFKMPGMDGLQLVEKVNQEFLPSPTIFMITGFFDYNQDDLKKLGIEKLYFKPDDVTDLISDVESFFH